MTPAELIALGERLYGPRWKTPLAHAIGVQRESVSRMAHGHARISRQVAAALWLLDTAPSATPYRERRHAATGDTLRLQGPHGGWALLVHGDSRREVSRLAAPVQAIVTDPVWPGNIKAVALAGSHDPAGLLTDVLRAVPVSLGVHQVVMHLRCDSDPRILRAVPMRWAFLRAAWLPYAVPSRQGRLLISGDIAYVFGAPPVARPHHHVLPGMPHPDYCPPAQPSTGTTGHPCPRSLEHVEWLIEKFTEPGATVLDPFMGSGTTGLAALRRGRNFIGIDIERHHVQEARERIASAAM